ncbi:MAG: hypothetical protein AAB798_02395 [Patescibacteria group bacterium]
MNTEKEIQDIQARNRRVEVDKAWEMSMVRRGSVVVLTYAFVVVWLISIENASPFLNAVIPAGGYFLSTLTLGVIKNWWQKR